LLIHFVWIGEKELEKVKVKRKLERSEKLNEAGKQN